MIKTLYIMEKIRKMGPDNYFIGPVYYNRHFLNDGGLAKLFHFIIRILFSIRMKLNFWHFAREHQIRDLRVPLVRR